MNDATLILALLGASAWFWYASTKAQEKVLHVSRHVCLKLNLQRLDDTVALRRLRVTWARGKPAFRRVYRFEFSVDGANRRVGEIALVGLEVEWIRVDRDGSNEFVVIDP